MVQLEVVKKPTERWLGVTNNFDNYMFQEEKNLKHLRDSFVEPVLNDTRNYTGERKLTYGLLTSALTSQVLFGGRAIERLVAGVGMMQDNVMTLNEKNEKLIEQVEAQFA